MSEPQSNLTEYTVSEISFALKRTVEEEFSHVRVRGEIGRENLASHRGSVEATRVMIEEVLARRDAESP